MDYAKLSVADLKSKLTAANVPFVSNAIKSKLIALLQAHDKKNLEAEKHQAEKHQAAAAPVASEHVVYHEMGDGMDDASADTAAQALASDAVLDDDMLARMKNIVDPMDASEDEDEHDSGDDDGSDDVGDGDVRTRVVPLYVAMQLMFTPYYFCKCCQQVRLRDLRCNLRSHRSQRNECTCRLRP